jgi:hypothetical protein
VKCTRQNQKNLVENIMAKVANKSGKVENKSIKAANKLEKSRCDN